jgi:hypothetical protein
MKELHFRETEKDCRTLAVKEALPCISGDMPRRAGWSMPGSRQLRCSPEKAYQTAARLDVSILQLSYTDG